MDELLEEIRKELFGSEIVTLPPLPDFKKHATTKDLPLLFVQLPLLGNIHRSQNSVLH